MATLIERKRVELLAKGSALEHEFEHWMEWTAEDGPFEKHRSQVTRITARLRGTLESIRDQLKPDAPQLLTKRVSIEQRILTVHAIWEFFHARLALRADDYLRPYLRACDEFAWSCYESVRDRYVAAANAQGVADAGLRVKEPPLVYLNGGWSPFAVSREAAFTIDRAAFNVDSALVGWLATIDFKTLVEQLPFPMIGVPWYQISHLPEALVIGHEMGHIVEGDFKLQPAIEDAFARATIRADHRDTWNRWRKEVFADIYGCLAGGPSFATTLLDFLAGDPSRIETAQPVPDGLYPMPWLRMRIAIAALECTKFGDSAAAVEAAFEESYAWPPTHQPFTDEATSIVGEVLKGPYPTLGGAGLAEVLPFPRDAFGRAADVDLAANFPGGPFWTLQPRALFAAAKRIYDADPQAFKDGRWSDTICKLVVAGIPKGTRGAVGADLKALADADRAAGSGWLE